MNIKSYELLITIKNEVRKYVFGILLQKTSNL